MTLDIRGETRRSAIDLAIEALVEKEVRRRLDRYNERMLTVLKRVEDDTPQEKEFLRLGPREFFIRHMMESE